MNKKLLILSLIIVANTGLFAQQSHTLTANNSFFTPDTLFISSGDTVNFVSNGTHSATEIDSADWANNIVNSNGGFDVGSGAATSNMWFVINTPGKYYYICRIHAASGMKGVIYVDQTAGIDKDEQVSDFKFYNLGDNSFQLEYEDCDQYSIYNLKGQLVKSGTLVESSNTDKIHCNLDKGTYIIRLSKDGKKKAVKKFVVAN